MSSYRDEYYSHVDELFTKLRPDPFKGVTDSVPQEVGGMGSIQPVGWVKNADGSDGTAKVTIDSDGITIIDGKIFLLDEGGDTVLNAAGFGGSWVDFLSNGFYNGTFAGGTTTAIAAVTEVSGGDTNADYAASISSNLPYWVVYGYTGGGGTFSRVSDGTSVGSFALKWDGIVDAEVYQDVPITSGQFYSFFMNWKRSVSAGEISQTIGYQFRDATHGAIGSRVNNALTYTTSQASYARQHMFVTTQAPASARYLRVWIRHKRNSGTVSTTISDGSLEKSSLTIGSNLVGAGSSFPSSPSSGDRFYRTDLASEFAWNGTVGRWLSTTIFETNFVGVNMPAASAHTYWAPTPFSNYNEIYILHCSFSIFISTTNNGSNYWKYDFYTVDAGGAGTVLLAGGGNSSGLGANQWIRGNYAVGALKTNAVDVFQFTLTTTGTPGALYAPAKILWQVARTT
jgi:hypothetical protein